MSEPSDVRALRRRLDGLTIRDAARLGRRLRNLRDATPEQVARVTEQIAAAEGLIATRAGAVPAIAYPDLPVSERRDDIAAAVRDHQVVVVAGETGSGKTTQLPKICLDLGRGVRGTIGHTQPRRLAARTVAQRVADELGTPLGDVVGYTVRFTDQASDRTLVKLMTDGILLAEVQRDRRLLAYDTLILDEAHERSLNIDFLLGYLRELLPRRPDLKVIVTSATIEPERFAAHFAGPDGPAPIVEVSGRTYPVEIRYRPLEVVVTSDDAGEDPDDPDDEIVRTELRDPTEAIVDAVRELEAEPPGDVLVFLSGEREIRDTAEALREALRHDRLPTEVLPLYARLPTAEQQKVFAPHANRRIVLSTNVAETSLTVPGIRYVVDPGTARISRYSRRTKVQRLPIEPISRASAAQRAGRSGRTAPGVCIRLYSQADFDARPRYTDPEILRTNLAAVILQMAALGLGDVEAFGFLDPPDARSIRDGVTLLQELGAFDRHGAITDVGRRLARLPLDPRIGRMILQADTENCVREVLVLAAALSIPDPRERPADREDAARQKHARFNDEHSDFVSYLNLWQYLSEQRRERSGTGFRRMCREEFLHYLRIREWQDLTGQLRSIARDLGIRESDEPADPSRVHAALTAGLLSHVGLREGDGQSRQRGSRLPEYAGARNTRFVLAPGSVLTKRPPQWIVVADLVETSRLFGRIATRIDPDTVERVAADLVVRSHSEPHWDARRGAVMAYERVTLYGLPLVPRRRVSYASIDPVVSRELFIRHALVEGDWQTRHHFFRDNAALLAELAELEERARRRDLVVTDDQVYALYDARIPANVVSARHFDAWWKKQRHRTPDLLTFTRDELLRAEDADDRPDTWRTGDLALPMTYRFSPGAEDDGITVHVPVDVLARLGGTGFAWHVPALREELVTALLKSLPKELRRNFVPVPDTARAVLGHLDPDAEPLLEGLVRELRRRTGVLVPVEAFDVDKLPAHLRVTFAVERADGTEVARGKDLGRLKERLATPMQQAVADAVAGDLGRTGLRGWPADLAEVPRTVSTTTGGRTVRGHPAFVDAGATVDLTVFATVAEQQARARAGVRRLLRLASPAPAKNVERALDTRTRLTLAANPDGSLAALIEDCADAAVDTMLPAPVWTRAEFETLRARIGARLVPTTLDLLARTAKVLAAEQEARLALPDRPAPRLAGAVADVEAQLARLLPRGFVTAAGAARLADLTRYLTAIARRLERLPHAVEADAERMARVAAVRDAYDDLLATLGPARAAAADVREIGWQIEEFRVSLWAQQLGTPRPVSEQRILRAIDAIDTR
ncbi:ATP-dependent RNA helicase HrpA [Mycolicibacterium grossiae]|uniref:ATP-dependent RNA helicase HrpA n=1 Tax=Mycolicibacterium grossiae TaxID=1552759 RepID=A0A1E8Q1J1_9MYCO|nr:ATP-dependent RNA helicase HrpA [Mycolicibacterium grossiae]OFJ52403.1 ATP-dependent RNA helicase HrpA [Mycolicibacterium grossiae]QEM44271.1 ATP-dependent RNA helicase HrpA [Mycolicibacterium grossiae]